MEVTKCFTFDAAHQLPWHKGKCKNLHGHTYKLEVTVSGDLDENGVVIDFADLKAVVDNFVLKDYDHQYINAILENPTAERIAQSIFRRLKPALSTTAGTLERIVLWETPTCYVTVGSAF